MNKLKDLSNANEPNGFRFIFIITNQEMNQTHMSRTSMRTTMIKLTDTEHRIFP